MLTKDSVVQYASRVVNIDASWISPTNMAILSLLHRRVYSEHDLQIVSSEQDDVLPWVKCKKMPGVLIFFVLVALAMAWCEGCHGNRTFGFHHFFCHILLTFKVVTLLLQTFSLIG